MGRRLKGEKHTNDELLGCGKPDLQQTVADQMALAFP